MDPFSITVGAVGLADAGTSLAGFLTEKYRSYRDAPELILEVAHEVEFCAGLVDMFAGNVDRAAVGGKVPGRFVKDAKGLVERTQIIFRDIEKLIPQDRDLDATFSKARWRFALDKKKLTEHQQRLRQAQQMFLFMESMYRYRYPVSSSGVASSGGLKDPNAFTGSGAEEQSLTGILANRVPMQATGVGPDGQRFEVTLTLKPVVQPVPTSTYGGMPVPEARSALPNPMRRKEQQGRSMLEGLRRSPFFDAALLSQKPTLRTAGPEFASYEEIIMPSKESKAKHKFYSHDPRSRTREEEMKLRREAQQMEKAEERSEGERSRLNAIDDSTAKADVDDFSRRWFGDSDDEDDDAALSVVPPDEYNMAELEPFAAAGSQGKEGYALEESGDDPRPSATAATYNSPDPLPPRTAYPPAIANTRAPFGTDSLPLSRHTYSTSRGSASDVFCDGCDKKIRSGSPRQQCRNCEPSFDLCAHCFADPEMTLRHRHPKSYFLRSTVS